MKAVICGGGTAGHVYPGLALAKALEAVDKEAKVFWIGTEKGLESKIVPEAGYEFIPIDAAGLQNRRSLEVFKVIFKLMAAYVRSGKILRSIGPDVVIGMGGYVSLPVMLAARNRYPSVVFEQNSIPGLSNRILASRVDGTALTFEQSRDYFNEVKTVRTIGNPIRPEVKKISRVEAAAELGVSADRFTVSIFGGSRGAKKINEAVIGAYDRYRSIGRLQIIHVTGNLEFGSISDLLEKKRGEDDGVSYRVFPFIDKIWLAYGVSDLVVCRSGATTIAEITAMGLPAIMIPYPHATDDHQTKNAGILEKAGAAVVIEDDKIDSDVLWDGVSRLMDDPEMLSSMAENSLRSSRPEAAKDGVDFIMSILAKNRRNI